MRPAQEFTGVIDDCYRRCDAIVGKALAYSDDETLVIALSDHGFNSFRRGVHLNTWLYDNGFLALRDGVKPGEAAGDLLRQVDWGRTQAYAVGLGGVYLNLKGREEQGIVAADQAEATRSALLSGLSGLTDPERGNTVAITGATRARRSIMAPMWRKHPTSSSISPRGTGSRGRRRWAGSPRASSRIMSKNGAVTISLTPVVYRACCS